MMLVRSKLSIMTRMYWIISSAYRSRLNTPHNITQGEALDGVREILEKAPLEVNLRPHARDLQQALIQG